MVSLKKPLVAMLKGSQGYYAVSTLANGETIAFEVNHRTGIDTGEQSVTYPNRQECLDAITNGTLEMRPNYFDYKNTDF